MAYQTKKNKSRAESVFRTGFERAKETEREGGKAEKTPLGATAALQLQMFDKIYCIVNFE